MYYVLPFPWESHGMGERQVAIEWDRKSVPWTSLRLSDLSKKKFAIWFKSYFTYLRPRYFPSKIVII